VGETLQAALTRNSLEGNDSPISSITSLGKRKPVQKTAPKKSSPNSKDDLFASMGLFTKPIFLRANAKASPAGRPAASRRAVQPNPPSLLPMPRHPHSMTNIKLMGHTTCTNSSRTCCSSLWWHLLPLLPLLLSVLALMMMRPVAMMTGTMAGTWMVCSMTKPNDESNQIQFNNLF
jgi:hypothetical protein